MKKIIASLLLCAMFPISACVVQASQKAEIYVDNNAVTDGDGSIDKPFKTIEEAKMAVREMKKNSSYPADGVDVILREGRYNVSETIAFNEEDSGLEGAPVTYKAYPMEKVSIVGGTVLTLGDFKPSDDSRLSQDAEGKIYSYNLKDNGIQPYDKLYCTGHSQYYLAIAFPDDIDPQSEILSVPEVFYNDQITSIARYPNGGDYLRVGDVIQTGPGVCHEIEQLKRTEWPPIDEVEHMIFKTDVPAEKLEKWKEEEEGWLFGYWKWDWSDQTTPIKTIDVEEGIIETAWPSAFKIAKGQRYYAFNMLCELDSPGEWYYDRASGDFFIYPMDSNKNSEIVLGFSSDDLIELNNCSNIIFRNIDLMATRRNGITANNCNNLKIFGSTIKNVSGNGVTISGGLNNVVDSCHIYNVGGGGIHMTCGILDTLEPGYGLIQNNWIHDFARLKKTYFGGINIYGAGNTIRYNTIHTGPHVGILFGSAETVIEYNEVYDVLREAADMGAMYGGNNQKVRGIIFRENVIHDIKSDSEQEGHYGIYFDGYQGGETVVGNLFYNIDGSGVLINGGRNCTVTENTFVNVNYPITYSAVGLDLGNDALQDRFGIVPGGWHTKEPWTKFPNFSDLLEDDQPMAPKYNKMTDNVYCNFEDYFDIHLYSATEKQMRSWSELNNGITVNMKDFVNPEIGDYRLKNSIEDKLPEYNKYNFHKAGIITARLKAALANDAVVVEIGSPLAYVDWEEKLIDESNLGVTPMIKNDLTYVPVRFMAEMLGGQVQYDNGKITISINGKNLELQKDSDICYIDGKEEKLAGACFIENDRTLVPLRSCSNLFDKEVFWDDRGLIIVSGEEQTLDEEMIESLIEML